MSTITLSERDAERAGLKVKKHKYRAKPCVVDGIRFASQKEARRYSELKLLEKAGKISSLTTQPRFAINMQGTFICSYLADFSYNQHAGQKSRRVVEDVKSAHTRKLPIYRLKKKLVEAQYGIVIEEL